MKKNPNTTPLRKTIAYCYRSVRRQRRDLTSQYAQAYLDGKLFTLRIISDTLRWMDRMDS